MNRERGNVADDVQDGHNGVAVGSETGLGQGGESDGVGGGVRIYRRKPAWIRAGDWAALLAIGGLFALGFLNRGFAEADSARAAAWWACAVLGLWSLAGWAAGRWSGPTLGPSRWVLLFFLVTVAWSGIQRIPLPADWMVSVSPAWKTSLDALDAAGIPRPERIPLAEAPERASAAWDEWVACLFFFSAVALLAARPRKSRILLRCVAVAALVEGCLGVIHYGLVPGSRASGAIYNANHHATFVLMGMPVVFVELLEWRRDRAGQGRGAMRGPGPTLFLLGVAVIALVGALASLSRGALLMGMGVLVVWGIVELVGWAKADLESGRRRGGGLGRGWGWMEFITTGVPLVVSLVLLVAAGAIVEGYATRFEVLEGEVSRLDLVRATWKGLEESRYLGMGLGGAECAINRFAEWPTITNAIWTHNDYAQVVSELGLPWACVATGILFMAGMALIRGWSIRRDAFEWGERRQTRAALAGVVIALAHAFTDFHLRVPLVAFAFLILLAYMITQPPLPTEEMNRRGDGGA